MAVILKKRSYCPSHKFPEMRGYHKYDLDFWKCLSSEGAEPNIIELKADLGRQIVSNLPFEFKVKNHGQFIAVTFTGKILTVCDTLKALNEEIAKKELKENYYIGRIGYRTIAQI